mmetsp:Transcript_12851/g.50287  ORF Transcript_12851/g.50287 Transcript_12851/m.50287 type:complete len:322 (+) Transcript_12851:178-1143(+)
MTGENGTDLASGDSGGVGGAAVTLVTALPPLSAGLGLGMSETPAPLFFFFFFPPAGFDARAGGGDAMISPSSGSSPLALAAAARSARAGVRRDTVSASPTSSKRADMSHLSTPSCHPKPLHSFGTRTLTSWYQVPSSILYAFTSTFSSETRMSQSAADFTDGRTIRISAPPPMARPTMVPSFAGTCSRENSASSGRSSTHVRRSTVQYTKDETPIAARTYPSKSPTTMETSSTSPWGNRTDASASFSHVGNVGYSATMSSATGLEFLASASLHCATRGMILCLYDARTCATRSRTFSPPFPNQPPSLARATFATADASSPR